MINVELHVIGGKHAGQVIPLNRKKFLIGRESDCQLRPNSELVSRHHCIFTVDDFSVRLRDLGSTNGTLVNGERIRKEVVLNPGDLVVVGSLEFNIVVTEVEDASSTGAIAAVSEETVVASTDTLPTVDAPEAASGETPAPEQPAAPAQTAVPEQPPAADAAAAPAEPPPNQTAMLPVQPAAPPEMPPASTGDTTVIAQPVMLPGQTPYQPMMPQQMGYPMYQQGYPYPGMQMYPPQGYPGMMPGYPQQQQPQMPQAPVPPEHAVAPESAPDQAEVTLPDPADTGAKAEQPKPKPPEGGEAPAAEQPASNKSAADIIQQHMNRRPGG